MRYKVLTATVLSSSLMACSNAASDPALDIASEPTLHSAPAAIEMQGNWNVDYSQSAIEFSGVQKGKAFTGSFTDFTAVINFDADNLEQSFAVVTIALDSADAGDSERNESLPGKDWFNVKAFPSAVFESRDFTAVDGAPHNYLAKGKLTVRDKTLPVTLPFTLTITGNSAQMSSQGFTLDRTDYGVGQGIWSKGEWVDKTVTVDTRITARRR